MKVHLVDGTYELFRNYFGAPPSVSATGQEVGATRGLMRTLLSLLRQPDVTHVGIAFDQEILSFRNRLFDGYKTGEGIEPDLYAQFPLAERATRALGIVTWPMMEFEADDALATAARQWTTDPRVEQIVICSPDKDLGQVVTGDEIVCLDRRRERILNEDGVREKFGVGPESIPDYLALVGDAADGIPGIPKWGAKASSTLLAAYGTIEDIPRDPVVWNVDVRAKRGLAESLNAHRAEAELYKKLATLRFDVPLEETLADLEWKGPRREELESFCAELGEFEILERIEAWRPGA